MGKPRFVYKIHGYGIYRIQRGEFASSNDGGKTMSRKRFSTAEQVDERLSRIRSWFSARNDCRQTLAMPQWAQDLDELASQNPLYIGGASYPSATGIRSGLGNNYFAVSGDGLLELLFEVLSTEGEFQFRYHNLYVGTPKGAEGYPSILGHIIHQQGVRHDDILTYQQIVALLETHNGCQRSKAAAASFPVNGPYRVATRKRIQREKRKVQSHA